MLRAVGRFRRCKACFAPRGECGDARFRLLSGKRGRVQLFSDRERLRALWFLLENAEAKRRTVDFDLTVSKK